MRLAVGARRDPASPPGALARVGGQLGISPDTLRNSVNQAEVDAEPARGSDTTDAERLSELQREIRERRRANAILRSTSAFFAAELDRPIQLLITDYEDQHKTFGVERIRAGLTSADVKIAPRTYYAHQGPSAVDPGVHDEALKVMIKRLHEANFGVRKFYAELGLVAGTPLPNPAASTGRGRRARRNFPVCLDSVEQQPVLIGGTKVPDNGCA